MQYRLELEEAFFNIKALQKNGERFAEYRENLQKFRALFGQKGIQLFSTKNLGVQTEPVTPEKALQERLEFFFTPNFLRGKRRKASNVEIIRAVFVDLDAGKDEHGRYYSTEWVNKQKRIMRRALCRLPEPSALVSTRNGYHAYWVFKPEEWGQITKEKWENYQTRIRALFAEVGADPTVKDPARLMRMPGTIWMKAGYDKAYCYVEECIGTQYGADELFRIVSIWETQAGNSAPAIPCRTIINAPVPEGNYAKQNDHIKAIKRLDHEYFASKYNLVKQTMNYSEAETYLKTKVSLGTFLSLPEGSTFCCILHKDRKPSANILMPAANRDYLYFCHRGGCVGHKGKNIVDMVKVLSGTNNSQAFDFLIKCFRISLPSKASTIKMSDLLEMNRKGFESICECGKKHRKVLEKLRSVYDVIFAGVSRTAEGLDHGLDAAATLVSISKRELSRRSGLEESDAFKKAVILAAMGLIEKVADEKLPDKISERDCSFSKKCVDAYGDGRTIQYYRVVELNAKKIREIQQRLEYWIESKGKIRLVSKTYIAGIFGNEVAASVYTKPWHKNTLQPRHSLAA